MGVGWEHREIKRQDTQTKRPDEKKIDGDDKRQSQEVTMEKPGREKKNLKTEEKRKREGNKQKTGRKQR